MSAQPDARKMTLAEYLAFAETSEEKHEYVNGFVYAMSGGTLEHSRISSALIRALGNALDGRPCVVFTSDGRVRVERTGTSTYPDASVVCGKLETSKADPHATTNPSVIFEVLSPTSEAYDRGAKANHYRQLPSLREYVLISQEEPRVEVQRLNAQGLWELRFFGKGEQIELASLDVRLSVDALYANPLPS